jgi:hypothetical protein
MGSDYSSFSNEIDALIAIAKSHDFKTVVAKMKSIVPEFLSMNSEYNELDK